MSWLDYRRKRVWGVALVLVYVLAGFFVVPPILRGQLVSVLQKSLDRPVTLERAGFNPLTLAVTLEGLKVTEKDGAPLLGFARLHVRLSPASLWQWAWSFGDITLEGFSGDIVRYEKGDTNIGRLVQTLSPKKSPAKPAKDDEGLRLIVAHLSIKNAAASFTDRVPQTDFSTKIGPISAEIDHFSTLADKTGQQHILIDLEKGSTLEWTSQSSLDPLASSGHIKAKGPYLPLVARYLGDMLKLSVPSGALDAELDYKLQEREDGDLGVSVDHLRLAVSDVEARDPAGNTPFVTLPKLQISGGHLAWPERDVHADSLLVDGLDVAMRRQPDGQIVPAPWAASGEQPPAAPQAQPPSQPQSEPAPAKPWAISLGKLEIRKAKGQLEDQALPAGGKIDIASFDATIESLTNKEAASFPVSASITLAGGGSAKIEGKASALPAVTVDAKLSVAGLPIAVAQPYLHDFAKLEIDDGKLDLDGDVTLHDPDGLKIVGQGALSSLKLKDEVGKQPVVSWDKLTIDRYVYRQDKNDLNLSQVTVSSPFLRFQMAADHSTNFSHILVPATPAKQAAPPPPPDGKAPLKITVGKVSVTSGSADYGDATLPLPFATHITNLEGNIFALSSTTQSASGMSLKGQVDQYGEVNIFGKVNPFHFGKGMQVNVVFRNVDFPGLSPYTVKFAGRRVAKGKVDVESRYAIDDGKLNGSNKVVIRQLELGEKVDVPGAMDMPLELAISLLKDDDGNINLDLPVSGNINDPQFELSGVIAKAVGDVLGDLVTAPFRALAGLFGGQGGDQLDHIDFLPGRADLAPAEKEKIVHVGELLQKKPKIALVVSGAVDKDADRQKLQRDAFDADMAKELGEHDMVGRQRRYMEGQYEKRIGKDQLAKAKQDFLAKSGQSGDDSLNDPAFLAQMRREVAKTLPIDEAALDKLGQSRGSAVVDALKQVQGMDPKRVTLQGNKEAKVADDGRIPLKLEAAAQD